MKSIYEYTPESEFYIDEGSYIIEMINTADDDSCSIARARVPVGITTVLHSLKGTIERYVILQGDAMVRIGEAEPVEVNPMDTVHIPANVAQQITNIGDIDLIFLCICTPRFQAENYIELESRI